MTGETKFTDRWNELEEECNKYKKFLNLNLNQNNEVEQYLNLDRDTMKAMDIEELAIAIATLSRHGIFIQQQYNYHARIVNWINANLDMIAVREIDQYKDSYLPFNAKRLLVINNNDIAIKFLAKSVEHKGFMDDLEKMSEKVQYYSESLSGLKFEKIRRLKQ